MYEIIMDYNYSVTAASTEAACMAFVVFMARDRSDINDGYEIFREHAALLGRLPEWVPWSDDEPCAQMNTTVSDSIDPMNALPFLPAARGNRIARSDHLWRCTKNIRPNFKHR